MTGAEMPRNTANGSDIGEYQSNLRGLGMGSWEQEGKFVLHEIERLAQNGHDDRNFMNKINLRLALLEARVMMWAALGSAIGGGSVSLIIAWFSKH